MTGAHLRSVCEVHTNTINAFNVPKLKKIAKPRSFDVNTCSTIPQKFMHKKCLVVTNSATVVWILNKNLKTGLCKHNDSLFKK